MDPCGHSGLSPKLIKAESQANTFARVCPSRRLQLRRTGSLVTGWCSATRASADPRPQYPRGRQSPTALGAMCRAGLWCWP